jgi:cytochrome P450
MAFEIQTVILTIIGISAAYFTSRLLCSSNHALPLPPGPKGLPLIGNINDLPKPGILECHHWLKHKDLYGTISSITVLGQTFVLINDADIAMELLRDRAVINSGRPKMVFSGDMIGWTNTLSMHQPNEDFKMHRRNIAKVASSAAILSVFDRVQEEESAHFLRHVLDTPDNLFDHIRKEAVAVVLKILYGYTPEAHGRDPFVDLASQTLVDFADAATPGRYVVDVMPFCKLCLRV